MIARTFLIAAFAVAIVGGPIPGKEARVPPGLDVGPEIAALVEGDYLCVYDRQAENHSIYWLDRDGSNSNAVDDCTC